MTSKQWKEKHDKPMTNRQWLESLSDEKLAEIIFELRNFACANGVAENGGCTFVGCAKCIEHWLQAEHKEDA